MVPLQTSHTIQCVSTSANNQHPSCQRHSKNCGKLPTICSWQMTDAVGTFLTRTTKIIHQELHSMTNSRPPVQRLSTMQLRMWHNWNPPILIEEVLQQQPSSSNRLETTLFWENYSCLAARITPYSSSTTFINSNIFFSALIHQARLDAATGWLPSLWQVYNLHLHSLKNEQHLKPQNQLVSQSWPPGVRIWLTQSYIIYHMEKCWPSFIHMGYSLKAWWSTLKSCCWYNL